MIRRTLPPLAAAALLTLTACGSDDTISDPVAETTPATEVETTEAPTTEAPTTEVETTEVESTDVETTEAPTTDTPTTDTPTTEVATTDAPATTDAREPSVEPVGSEVMAIADLPAGMSRLTSTQSFADTVASAVAAIEGNEALTLVATIDHSANASSVAMELPPTTELIFGDPTLGTPLMMEEIGAGLDLPQKMLIVEDVDGTVGVYWTTPDYIASRYGLGPASLDALGAITQGLLAVGQAAAATDAEAETAFPTIGNGEGIVTTTTTGTARDAADRLIAAIESDPDLMLVADVDHAAAAASVGMELPPSIEILFGNPNLGTPLMRESRTFGIDLPQTMLFVEGDDGVTITYTDPAEVAVRHGVDDEAEPVPTITAALEQLAAAAAG